MNNRIILIIILIVLPIYLLIGLYFIDKEYFVCPVTYKANIMVRCDSRGDGYFAANRNGRRVHRGLDLLADIGAPVLAARSGRAKVLCQPKGMGNYIIIQHAQGVSTLYGHLSRIYIKDNKYVRQGEIIGAVGKSGNASHPDMLAHLHLEVRDSAAYRDPLEYLQ